MRVAKVRNSFIPFKRSRGIYVQDIDESLNNLNELKINMNGAFAMFFYSSFSNREGKSAYDTAICFEGKRCFSAKEAKACAIFSVLRKAKHFGFHKIQIFSDAQEVINTINWAKDMTLRNFVEDIDQVSKYFVSIRFSYTSRKFIIGLLTVLQSLVLSKMIVLNRPEPFFLGWIYVGLFSATYIFILFLMKVMIYQRSSTSKVMKSKISRLNEKFWFNLQRHPILSTPIWLSQISTPTQYFNIITFLLHIDILVFHLWKYEWDQWTSTSL